MAADEADHSDGQSLGASISNAIVRLLAESTGRGPTKARTTIDRDLVVVMLANALTKGERYLVDNGDEQRVLEMRAAFQSAMANECRAAVEDLTGRKVVAFMSANHVEPDMAAEIFVLEPN